MPRPGLNDEVGFDGWAGDLRVWEVCKKWAEAGPGTPSRVCAMVVHTEKDAAMPTADKPDV